MKRASIVRVLTVTVVVAALSLPVGAHADVPTETPLPISGTPLAVTPTQDDIGAPATPAPVIVVTSYTTSVEHVAPGSAFDLELTLHNATNRRADNVVVVLGAGGGADATAAGAASSGLTVLETGNAKYVGALRGQREVSVSFRVIVSPGTSPGALSVPITVSFEHTGARQEVGYTVGLLVERTPSLSLVTAEVPDSAVIGESFPVSFELANASGFALSGVTLSVEASGAAVADGTVFLGTMDAAVTEVIDATVTAEQTGELEIAVVLSYRDDFGKPQLFRETRTVTVTERPEVIDDAPDETPDDAEGNWFTRFFKALFGLGD